MNLTHKPEEYFLSNGIPVVLQHFDGPVGTLHWWNLTGSTDENPNEAGFAHFLEHMLFKDASAKETGRASSGQTARAIESMGGEINAYTSFDQTVYHVTCSEQYWEKVIDQFGIMAKPQRFLREDFEREREVILEELRRGQDSPDRQLYEKLFGLTYTRHPYRRPVIGFEKVLKAANAKKLETFFNRQYVSSRMGLVLVGPVHDQKNTRKKKILSLLEKRYGKSVIPKRPAPSRNRPAEPAIQSKAKFSATHFDVKTPEFAASFRVPELKHHDVAQLEVLAGVMGMGESSRLYQKLFYEKSMVTDIGASVYVPRDPGMFLLSYELKHTSDLETVSEVVAEEIRALQKNGPSKDEIERVVTNLESEKLYSTQTVDGLANRLGFLRFSLGDLKFDHEYLENIKQASPRTLKTMAEKYLIPGRMSGVLLQPKSETALSFQNTERIFNQLDSQKSLLTKSPSLKGKKKEPAALEPQILTTSNGLKFSYFERAGAPVFSLYFASEGGTRYEWARATGDHSDLWGASHLLAQTWAKGTPTLNSKQISHIIEGSAASLDGFSGRNTIGLQMTGLTRDWRKLSSLFEDVLLNPTFQQDELAHAKRVTSESIKSIPDHSSQVCSKLFMENLFHSHPYGKHPLGTLEQVEQLSEKQLHHIHSQWVRNANSAFSIVSGIPYEEVREWFESLDQKLASRFPGPSEFANLDIPTEAPLVAPRWAASSFGREQTHIMIGGLGISLCDQDRYALRLLQNILGGQSGRLFIELREKKSLAYTVSPMVMEGLEKGYVGTYIACAPQKTKEATHGMAMVLEKLAKSGPTPAEMKRAKNYYLGQRAMDLQSSWSLASHFGLELLYRDKVISEEEIRKEIEKVTAQQIQKICARLFVQANKVTVTVS